MSDDRKRLQIYVTPEEYKQLKEWSNDVDKSMSEVGRNAIREYTDQDRLKRIEEKIDTLQSDVHTLAENDTHTHTNETSMYHGKTKVEKARDIIRRLQENQDKVISTVDVERAIEDMAGADPRTIKDYKSIFRRRGHLYEHPGSSEVWTTDTDEWLSWMQEYAQLNGMDMAEEEVNQYPANIYTNMNGKIQIEAKDE